MDLLNTALLSVDRLLHLHASAALRIRQDL